MEDDKMLSTIQVSKILNVSVSTISRWFDQGILTGIQNPLTNWRKINTKSIDELLKKFNLSLPEDNKEKEDIKEKSGSTVTENNNLGDSTAVLNSNQVTQHQVDKKHDTD